MERGGVKIFEWITSKSVNNLLFNASAVIAVPSLLTLVYSVISINAIVLA